MNLESKSVKKKKKVFIKGAIAANFIGESIAKHQSKTNIGAHHIFLGQVRGDRVGNQNVKAIEYTAYREMAEAELDRIREQAFEKYNLVCMHIYHSIGQVETGEICLFVFVSAEHREASFEASKFIVEEIKAKVPIFGKEILEDESHQWKVNK